MDQAADQARQYAMWLTSINAEVQSERFSQWVGAENASLTLVFTDVLGSMPLASQFADEKLNDIRKKHFAQIHSLADKYKGREVKALGDAVLCVFRSSVQALDFAIAIRGDTGHKQVTIRAGIHIGAMNIEQGDTFATHVNLATCIAGMAKGAEIWVSDRVKQHIDEMQAGPQRHFNWQQRPDYQPEGLSENMPLWSVASSKRGGHQAAPAKTPSSVLQAKIDQGKFDVFLCHNSDNKAAVKEIGEQLKALGILPWLDEWELRPGLPWQRTLEEQITNIQAVAVFVGADGMGPWQSREIEAFLREFDSRDCPVIPVVLPDSESKPKLPMFLKDMTWVDFRQAQPDPL